MSDEVDEYIDRVNRERGRKADDGDDGNHISDPTEGGLYGGGSWESPKKTRFGGYAPGGSVAN